MQSLKQLKDRIVSFVNQPTTSNFALMIDGEWGSGKTYFIKEILFPALYEQTSNKTALYVSLNGVNSFEEIYEQLTTEKFLLKGWAKTKVGKATIGAFNAARKLYGTKTLNDLMKEAKVKLEDFADFSKNVIVFDDLERIGKGLSIEDLFGFINTNFIEHNTTKVIIVGWEEQLIKRFKEYKERNEEELKKYEKAYKDTKNKIINWTLIFQNNIEEVIKSLIKVYSIDNKEQTALGQSFYFKQFHSFLQKNQDFLIQSIIRSKEKNIRNILFVFDTLLHIHNSAASSFKESDEAKKTTLAVLINCLEYRARTLTNPTLNRIIQGDLWVVREVRKSRIDYDSTDKEEIKKKNSYDFLKKFEESYTNIDLMYWSFPSIEKFVTTGSWKPDDFYKELEENRKPPGLPEKSLETIQNLELLANDDEYEKALKTTYQCLKEYKYDLHILISTLLTLLKLEKDGFPLHRNEIEDPFLNALTKTDDLTLDESTINQQLAQLTQFKDEHNWLSKFEEKTQQKVRKIHREIDSEQQLINKWKKNPKSVRFKAMVDLLKQNNINDIVQPFLDSLEKYNQMEPQIGGILRRISDSRFPEHKTIDVSNLSDMKKKLEIKLNELDKSDNVVIFHRLKKIIKHFDDTISELSSIKNGPHEEDS